MRHRSAAMYACFSLCSTDCFAVQPAALLPTENRTMSAMGTARPILSTPPDRSSSTYTAGTGGSSPQIITTWYLEY